MSIAVSVISLNQTGIPNTSICNKWPMPRKNGGLWNPYVGRGLYQSCQKIVTDFYKMSDEQIGIILRHYKGNTCGRFYVDQINGHTIPSRPLPWLKYLFTVTLPAIFWILHPKHRNWKRQIHQMEVPASGVKLTDVSPGGNTGTVINGIRTAGTLCNGDDANNNQGTATDSAGRFTFKN